MSQLEVGAIVTGKVTGITKFGAFVELENGKTGMVHISEVANTFVNEIRDHVTEGQEVKMKVLALGEDGKISLSIKKAEAPPKPREDAPRRRPEGAPRRDTRAWKDKPSQPAPKRPTGDFEWQTNRSSDASFEDMMARFKQTSDEKISDLKRAMDSKHGGFSRKTPRS